MYKWSCVSGGDTVSARAWGPVGLASTVVMSVPYMFGPGGQPILMGQVPQLIQQQQQQSGFPQQQQQQQQQQQHMQVTPQAPSTHKAPDYMNEDKLQDKGAYV